MTKIELPTRFDFATTEAKWTQIWHDKAYFHPQVDKEKETFSIAFPPPNVTGSLHMGHAANASVQDALIRSKRMQGFNTLWTLGTDHAGIGTQVMVEKELKKEGATRHELGREAFLERVWQWKEVYGNRIFTQMKRLGASGDFRRARFTMDEGYSKAIRKVFVEWYNAGIIYRARRMVNWDHASQTVLSDLEVESKEEKGHMWHIRYPLTDDPSRHIIVATTRPETMLGDSAVAVHPDDERYKDLIGKTVTLPLSGRQIPIVGDGITANPEFGSGAVKITPAHDFNDWECGERNNLEVIQVIDYHAKINDNAPEKYRGLKVNKAREVVVADLEEEGFLVKIDDHVFLPGRSSRTGVIVEPLPMVQWWVKMEPLAKPANDAIKSGKVKYYPERYSEQGAAWLEDDIRDWCISRQLWWGHQLPVWYDAQGEIAYVGETDPSDEEIQSKGLVRDPDVLDTWFSSSLWTFATLGWPDKTPELEHFHTTSVLSTGRDIINLWVARMIFCSLYFLDEIPFENVLIHATIQTKDGKRMSKSKGTGIDPLDMADKFGADACRFWLAGVAMTAQDIRFSEEKLESGQHFVTKIFNASRFVMMNNEDYDPNYQIDLNKLDLSDRWILSKLSKTVEVVTDSLADFSLTAGTKALYQFIWNEFCDWYVEISKPRLETDERQQVQAILMHCLNQMLKLLHPFMPFVSEELWSEGVKKLSPNLEGEHLCVAPWPKAKFERKIEDEDHMDALIEAIRSVRNIRAEVGIPSNKEAEKAYFASSDSAERELIQNNQGVVCRLARLGSLEVSAEMPEVPQSAQGVSGTLEISLPLAGLIDFEKEKARLQGKIDKLLKDMGGLEGRLKNQKFMANAPEKVVQEVQDQHKELSYQKGLLEERLAKL